MDVSSHVETVVLLRGEIVDGHVEIDLDVDKPGKKSGTATYAEIKAYVEEKYGFKVSTLYIAQMKDKVGMEKRKNYNPGSGERVRFRFVRQRRKRQSWMLSGISI